MPSPLSPLMLNLLLHLHSAYPMITELFSFPVCWYSLHYLLSLSLSLSHTLHINASPIVLNEPFKPELCLWTHPPHPQHCTELLLTPLSQSPHGQFPVTFVLLGLIFNPFASVYSFHLNAFFFNCPHALSRQHRIVSVQWFPWQQRRTPVCVESLQ